ncbi:alpha-actinin [Tritrichomonas musculus]|uniref:Alpha-actinin n=1 Tax=Tritrichomonas musculus TaxID=1915356 RepID=A0ABR2HJY0_9EUKA
MNEEIDAKTKIQIKVYSKWVADKLKDVKTCKVEDITTDLSDGTALIELAEILTKTKAGTRYHRKSIALPQKVEKCNKAIQMFKDNGIELGDTLSGKDIYDKNVKQTLYLIWMLILNYSVDPAVREVKINDQNPDLQNDMESRNSIKLITWATEKINKHPNVQENFKPYDLAICALLHQYFPDEINYEKLNLDDHDANITMANNAMEKLQIPVYVTPEDIKENNYNIDETCLITQLAALKIRLDQKFPLRKSIIERQNRRRGEKPKIEKIVKKDDKTQTESINPQLNRSIDQNPVDIYPKTKKEIQSNERDTQKVKVTTRDADIVQNPNENNSNLIETRNDGSPSSFEKKSNSINSETKKKNINRTIETISIYSQSSPTNNKRHFNSNNIDITPDPNFNDYKNKKRNYETRDIDIQPDSNTRKSTSQKKKGSPKIRDQREVETQADRRRSSHRRSESVSESSSSPRKLKIKVNGNIDRPIVITVRNFSHHSNKNDNVNYSHNHHDRFEQDSPIHSTSKYRSHTPRHSKRSNSIANTKPISYSVPNTPKNRLLDNECSIVPVYKEDGNRTPGRKFKVHVKNQDFHAEQKFSDNVSGLRIFFNENQDKDSQREEQDIDA